MARAHEYLEIPKSDFEVPDTIVAAKCGGRSEVFVNDVQPAKPGICRAPTTTDGTPTATPKVPKFAPRTTPTPTPEPEPTPTPTPELEPTPDGEPEPLLTPEPEETPPGEDGEGGHGPG